MLLSENFHRKNASHALKISNKANDLAISATESAEKTEKIKDKNYTDFIAILGIFTVVLFLARVCQVKCVSRQK